MDTVLSITDEIDKIKKEINKIKKERKFSQNDIAKELGISQAHLSYILSGKRLLSIETLIKIENFIKKFSL